MESRASLYKTSIEINGSGNKIVFEENVRLFNSKIVIRASNARIRIGRNTSAGGVNIICMGDHNEVIIGENCMISENVEMWNSDSHPIFDATTGEIINKSRPVIIGNHVWIGKNATILKGVNIGHGSIVGMNSTVTKNIEPDSIVVGNDNKIIRRNISWDGNFTRL